MKGGGGADHINVAERVSRNVSPSVILRGGGLLGESLDDSLGQPWTFFVLFCFTLCSELLCYIASMGGAKLLYMYFVSLFFSSQYVFRFGGT